MLIPTFVGSYRGKTGRGTFLPPILNRVKLQEHELRPEEKLFSRMALGEHFGERKNGTFSFHETTFMF